MERSASGSGSAGWCIHGVAYGPLWACQECSPGSVIGRQTTFHTTAQPVITRADVDQIIRLLISIDFQLRTRR